MHTKVLTIAEDEVRVHHNSDFSGLFFIHFPKETLDRAVSVGRAGDKLEIGLTAEFLLKMAKLIVDATDLDETAL